MTRHKHFYRGVNLPFAAVRGWDIVETVKVFYDQDRDEVVVRPVRVASGTQAKSTATAKTSVTAKTAEPVDDHSPQSHFRM
ncbi:MAG: hypothetical protein ABR985_22465 [Methanotrichaceae archaeon]